MRKISSIADIAAWQLCCGCGACAYVVPDQIEVIDTLEYGRRPRIKSDIDMAAMQQAMNVCPGIELTRPHKPDDQLGGEPFYSVWGPVLGVWEGHAADPQIRFEGSSGGVATALANYAMEKLNMAGTLHIAARQDVPYLNHTIFSRTKEQLLAGAGSRYAPASPCDGLKMIEDAPSPCVFIGKPCDAATVRKAMKLRPKLAEKIGLTIAFFCAGTPSTQGTLKMVEVMGVKAPTSIRSLRYRGNGWPGMASVCYEEEGELKKTELTYEQSWGEILQKYRQWRCYICPDHIGEFADIAVADAWHRPVADHQPGRSVIIARTPRGREILEMAIQDRYLKAEPVSATILPLCRRDQAAYQGKLWVRLQTLKTLMVSIPKYRGFGLVRFWRTELSNKEKMRSIFSTIKRVFVKQLRCRRKLVPFIVSNRAVK
jgi:coenzyme F420 hydrogenase subunit beta